MRFLWIALIALLTASIGPAQEPNVSESPAEGPAPGLERSLAEGPKAFLDMAVVGPQGDGTWVVATTQIIDPAGESILFPGRPVGVALSPDQKTLAVKSMREVVFIDPADWSILQQLAMPGAGASFHGIAWAPDGQTLWVTSATTDFIGATRGEDGAFSWTHEIALPGPDGAGNSAPGGFAFSEDGATAYVALSRNNAVAVVDIASEQVVAEIPVGIAPYKVIRLGAKLYVTNWGGRRADEGDLTGPTSGSLAVIDEAGIASTGTVSVIDLAQQAVTTEITVDLHPSGMAVSPDTARVYVANANSDTISVIDTATDALAATWDAKPMVDLPFGSAPNALAASPDGDALYVALGGNNCIAVLDTESGRVRGLIPTGWYPGELCLTADGGRLFVANTKGVGGRDDRAFQEQRVRMYGSWEGLNSHDHMGSVTAVDAPDASELAEYTYRTATNMRLPKMRIADQPEPAEERLVPVPMRPGEKSVFKHVIYVIKENRTYDQVFGDMPQGNGAPELCHFGREVTPNHHALAEEFVLLDNFYCNGVLSADGHQWTNEGYVTDYLEKSFGGFTRSYPYAGDDALAYASSGFIWDHVLAAGLTFRNYGEMVQAHIDPPDAAWSDIYAEYLSGERNISIRAATKVRGLEDYICPTFVGFPGTVQDVYRMSEFLKEFREFEKNGDLPNFTIMLLPNDHTVGTRPGLPTPRATVADNDLALGQLVEAVSHSPFWPETAIFVVQDDPQNGLDHVDGRRTVAFCISPYTKRGEVISNHYNQNSMLRTIELILGLQPMNQLNMAANVMDACFMDDPDLTPYDCRPNEIPLDETNPPVEALQGLQRYHAQLSLELELDDIDRADEGSLNRIVWHSVKGYDVPYPEIERRPSIGADAWPGVAMKTDDD